MSGLARRVCCVLAGAALLVAAGPARPGPNESQIYQDGVLYSARLHELSQSASDAHLRGREQLPAIYRFLACMFSDGLAICWELPAPAVIGAEARPPFYRRVDVVSLDPGPLHSVAEIEASAAGGTVWLWPTGTVYHCTLTGPTAGKAGPEAPAPAPRTQAATWGVVKNLYH